MSTWFSTPQPIRTAVIAVAWFSYGVLICDLNSLNPNTRTAEIIWGVCLAGAAITLVTDAGVHRRFGSAGELLTYNRALETGDLPEGIDVLRWRRRFLHSHLVIALAWMLFGPLILFGVVSSALSHSTYHWLLQWDFTIMGALSLAVAFKRHSRIKALESALEGRRQRRRSGSFRLNEREKLQALAETSSAAKFVSAAMAGTVFALPAFLLADLDVIVYGNARGSHLLWAAIGAAAMGVAGATFFVADPYFHTTTRTVDEIGRYERAFWTGELPEHLDVEVWRGWMNGRRKSAGAVLLLACFYWLVGCWMVLSHSSGYHWVVGFLLELVAIRQFLSWRCRRARITRLSAQLDRHGRMQPFSPTHVHRNLVDSIDRLEEGPRP